MFDLEKFAYNRYNKFVYGDEKVEDINELKDLLPFVLENSLKFNEDEIEAIDEILSSEITKERSKKTFSTFENVVNSSDFEIFLKQILHYMTTYGMNLQGNDVFIDNENFKKIVDEIIPIQTMSKSEFKEVFLKDIQNTLQWKQDEIENILEIFKFFKNELEEDNELDIIEKIPSKELKLAIYETFNIVPKDAEEFMRFLAYRITGSTLLIKNNETILKFRMADAYEELNEYITENGYVKLAEIFNRYKPLFLALKDDETKSIINKISKLSKIYHKPKVQPDYLSITEKIEKGLITKKEFKEIAKGLDTSYLIKLGNSLKFRVKCAEIGVYQIRNGKIFFKEVNLKANYKPFYKSILKIISKRINKVLKEKNIKFNADNFALPTSGKQFTGQIPNGTKVKDFNTIGVFWNNIGDESVDLDFSLTNENNKIGWNSKWKSSSAIYSGDMTDAKNGATESFLIKKGTFSVKLNWFNANSFNNENCPFTLFLGNIEGKEAPKTMITDVVYKTNMEVSSSEKQLQLGMIVDNVFYFGEVILPNFGVAELDSKLKIKATKALFESKIRFEDLDLIFNENAEEVSLNKSLLLEIVS